MRYAIENSLTYLPTTTDMYIICDGDISPFVLEGGLNPKKNVKKPKSAKSESINEKYNKTSWQLFKNKYNKIKFHFISVGSDAETEKMTVMSEIGGGTFSEVNTSE